MFSNLFHKKVLEDNETFYINPYSQSWITYVKGKESFAIGIKLPLNGLVVMSFGDKLKIEKV